VERYVPGPAIDEPIARVRDTGNTTYFHTNRQGSVIAMSGTSGALSEGPFTYSPYGVCTSGGLACPASGIPYRYTGRRFDPETGLYYYRARYYAPDDTRGGRFYQTDPVGYTADLNLYAYVGNDPTDREDALGLMDDYTADKYSQAVTKMSPRERTELAINGALIAIPGGLELRGATGLGRVFWSGKGAEEAALQFARSNGGKTLEMTLRGKFLVWLGKRLSWDKMKPLWRWASKWWATGARGEADVFLGEGINPEGNWKGVEEPILQERGTPVHEHTAAGEFPSNDAEANVPNSQKSRANSGCPAPQPGLSCGSGFEIWH